MNRITRRLAGAAAAALAVTTLSVATSAPAHAACSATVKLSAYKGANEYGGYNSVSANASPSGCSSSTTVVQRSTNGGKSWSTVGSGYTYASYYGSGKFNRTAKYRALYRSGTQTVAVTAARTIKTFRKVTIKDKSTRRSSVGLFVIRPAASIKGMKAKFQVKRSGGWRKYKKVRVPGTGKIKVRFKNSRKGIKYRMVLPSGRGMAKSKHGPITARRY